MKRSNPDSIAVPNSRISHFPLFHHFHWTLRTGFKHSNPETIKMNTTTDDHISFTTRPLLPPRTISASETTILYLVADSYGYGYRDRMPVAIEAIRNRTFIDNYFLRLHNLQLQSPGLESSELREHKQRLKFFQAYYLLAYGYYTERELKEHPGVLQIVKDMRDKGELKDGDDIAYAGAGGAGRERGYSGTSAVQKEKKKKGLLRKLFGSM